MGLWVYNAEGETILSRVDPEVGLEVGAGYVNNYCVAENVAMIQASGAELAAIRSRVDGVPSIKNSQIITTWRAPWAQFIAENLYL